MNQWYRKSLTKVIVLLVGIVSGAAFAASLGVALTFAGTVNPSEIMNLVNEPYEESSDFNSAVEGSMAQTFGMFRVKDLIETDGTYDPNKEIDILSYTDPGEIRSSADARLVYTLGDLIRWSEDYSSSGESAYDENVIVCQDNEEDYHYYYLNDFISLFERGELTAEFDNEYQTQAEFLRELADGDTEAGFNGRIRILDSEGNELFTDCWNFGPALRESYPPAGADDLLDVVNNTPELNGKLADIYDRLSFVLSSIYSDYTTYENGWEYLEEGNTNFTYLYVDREKKQVLTNKAEYEDYAKAAENIREMKAGDSVKYMIVNPRLKDFETNMNLTASGEWNMVRSYETRSDSENVLAVAVDISYPIEDQFYEGSANYNQNIPFLRGALFLFIAGSILFTVSAVWLAVTAGKKPGDEKLYLTAFDHWKTEISAALVIGLWGLITCVCLGLGTTFGRSWTDISSAVEYYGSDIIPVAYSTLFTNAINMYELAGVFFYGLFTFLCFFAGYVSLVRRIKAKIVWKGSLLYALISFIGERVMDRFREEGSAAIGFTWESHRGRTEK